MSQARRSPRTLALLAVLVSTLGSLLLVEVALRVASGTPFSRPDPAAGSLHMVGGVYPGAYDPLLGYVPRPGASLDNPWGTTVNIRDDGTRSNGPDPPPAGPVVLAVGDSFTFGDEVNDEETWPARLEERLARPVLNGGVFGYGLDQIVLRSERLLAQTGATTLVVAFTSDDVRRCEYAYRYAWKPWFEPQDGGLALHGVPVPEPGAPPPDESLWRRALRTSFLADLVMRRLDPQGWMIPGSLRVHRQGVSVGRLLVDRLADAAEAGGHELLLVYQWHPLASPDAGTEVIEHAVERGVPVLELEPVMLAESARQPEGVEALFHVEHRPGRIVAVGHMTPLGNAVAARVIAARLRPGTMRKTASAPPAKEGP